MKYSIIIFILLVSSLSYAEVSKELKNKVARNSINCFVGHKMAGSYTPSVANRYLAASFVLLGVKETYALVDTTENNIKLASKMLGTSIKIEGIELVYKFCPEIHKLTSPETALGKRIDEFSKKYNNIKKPNESVEKPKNKA